MSAAPPSDNASPPPNRLAWVDLLRGLAVLGMVETHVVNVFLSSRFEDATWRSELSFFNGLLAPTFLWIAGYIQGLAIRRAHQLHRPVVSVRRWQRLGSVALIGYLLHIPWHLWGGGDFGLESWRIFLQVDVLPCLAVSLGILLLTGCLRNKAWFEGFTLAALVLVVVAAPFSPAWHTGFLPLDGYLNRTGGSLFPLFPWFGFCAAGCLMSRFELNGIGWWVAAALMAFVSPWLAPSPFSSLQPAFFIERLGWLLGVALIVKAVSRFTAPNWLQLAGRESLFIYVVHLVLLHSIPAGGGITWDKKIGQTFSPGTTAAVFFALTSVCLLLAWANEKRKVKVKALNAVGEPAPRS
ncbi:MAG TPA: heparan-alpha-glucosaminide N-acetyltransferase domain-containing protein [Verrucomicrobium sp.]|nr:heparan-alpha-glucosaminide N-acetyltransferase domain-containing protein [Verrucomicrobium sp.]